MKNQQEKRRSPVDEINAQYGKLPPQAIEVEEAVLGSLMLEAEAYYKVAPLLVTECFYKEAHQKIYETIAELASGSHKIDLLTVTRRLIDKNIIEEVGGPGEITRLTRRVASAAHIEQHARIIYEKYFAREVIRFSAELQNAAYDDNTDELEMMYSMQTQHIDDLMAGNTGMMHIRDVLRRTTEDLLERQEKIMRKEIPGVTTGLADMDRLNSGWQISELIVLAARPAMGKTALALHFAKSAAERDRKHVCIFSLEMENIRLSQRLILSNGGIERDHFKNRTMGEADWKAYNQSAAELSRLPIYIDDTAATTVKYIEAVVRNKVRRNECDLVIIDYLQLIETPQAYGNKNREREVAEITRALKKLTKMVPVILLAQLNRGVENREDKTPRLADLRESGAIEQDADIVIFPWRPCYYDPEAETEDGVSLKNTILLEVAKYRDGKTTTIVARHNEDLTRFYDFNTYNQHEYNYTDSPY